MKQTYENFELIIVDDASFDKSWEIIQDYAKTDKRIRILRNQRNYGVSRTVKRAIKETLGKFLARMDADDIAHPNRLRKQVAHLLNNPQTVAVGSQCFIIDSHGDSIGKKNFPISSQEISHFIFRFSPLQQPTLMINRHKLPAEFEFYLDGLDTAEEIELIFKLLQYGEVENLPFYLLKYRIHSANTSFKNIRRTFYLTLLSRIKAVIFYEKRPSLVDILINVCQLIFVTFLPREINLKLYRYFRKIATPQKLLPLASLIGSALSKV